MLEITIPKQEVYDSVDNRFYDIDAQLLRLEHSLVSLHKWEMKYHKPFLSEERMSNEETVDYIRFMTITQNVNPMVYRFLTEENFREVNAYIENPMTATWFSKPSEGKTYGRKRKEIVTAELIYYWMFALNIPMECQKWHLNSLLTLIQVCNIKNTPPKKMSKSEILSRHKSLNETRKAAWGTKG